jgi:tripartite-type tricarboxylate transporter receptor subunit TctC
MPRDRNRMNLTRRQALVAGAAAGLVAPSLAAPSLVRAQTKLPFDGPIKLISGFSAGGSQDTLARLIGEELQRTTGRTVLVENRSGAGSRQSALSVKEAAADGSQILVANIATLVLIPVQNADTKYDPIADFVPLVRTTDFPAVVSTGKLTGARDWASLVTWLKANPEKASYGIPAPGSIPHLYGLALSKSIGVPFSIVPYRGGTPQVPDLLAGSLAMGAAAPLDFLQLHRAKDLTIVAASGTERHPSLSDVPTFAELGLKGFERNGWNGFFIKAGTSPELVALYEKLIADASAQPAVRQKLIDLGFIMRDIRGAAFAQSLKEDLALWADLSKGANLKP